MVEVETGDLGSQPDLGHCFLRLPPPPSMPRKAAFLVSGPLSHSQGSSQGFAALPWETPLYFFLASSQVCLFSRGGSGDSGT